MSHNHDPTADSGPSRIEHIRLVALIEHGCVLRTEKRGNLSHSLIWLVSFIYLHWKYVFPIIIYQYGTVY
jgi:hypothetical protein